MEDDTTRDASDNQQEFPPLEIDDISPEDELDQDINNLSIEDSPGGPGIRIADPEVSIIPDSLPPSTAATAYDKALDVQLDNFVSSTPSSSLHVTIDSFHSQDNSSNNPDCREVRGNRPPLRKPFTSNDNINQPVTTANTDTPFSSATDIVADKSTGAITKIKPTTSKEAHNPPDNSHGCVPITNFFRQAPRTGTTQRTAPNICSWREPNQPTTHDTAVRNTAYKTPNTFNEPLPQRPANKRARRDTGSKEDTSCPTHVPIAPQVPSTSNNTAPTNADTGAPPNAPNTNSTTANTDRNVSFSIQGEDTTGDFLPIPPEGLPFFRRARGCFSAETRANSRATHLDRLSDNGKPPRWAYGIGPMPSYMQSVATELVNIKKRHALEFTRAVARSLRDSSLASQRQGNLNLDTVQGIYGQDARGFDRASVKLSTLVSRDNTQENERLSRREELISRSPTTDNDIVDHLSGRRTATRSYAGVVANDPPQGNDNANRDNPPNNRNGRSRSRQRSRSRNRGGRANRANPTRRNDSRSPNRARNQPTNQRNEPQRNRSRERRAAQPGRGQRNGNRRQSRNNNRDRDSAFDYMEKMFEFFRNR